MTIKNIMEIREIFTKRKNEVYSVSSGLKIARFLKKTEDVEKFFHMRQKRLFEECVEKNENGTFVVTEGGYKLRDDKTDAYQIGMRELYEEETEETISFSETDAVELKLTVDELRAILEFTEV